MKAPLPLQPDPDGKRLPRRISDAVATAFDLVQRPVARLNRQPGDLHQLFGRVVPPGLAGREDVEEGGARGRERPPQLLPQIAPVADAGLGDVGCAVGRDDLGEILPWLELAALPRAHRGRRRARALRRGAAALDPRVHVPFVVVADVQEVIPALNRPGQALQPDIVGAAISADGHDLGHGGDLPSRMQGLRRRLDARGRGRSVLKGVVQPGHRPRRVRVDRGDDLQAAGRVHDDHRAGGDCQQHADDHGEAAAGAGTVPRRESLGPFG
jgi:hypothetical protein